MKSLSIKSIESAAVLAFGIALLCGAAGAGELVGAARSGEVKDGLSGHCDDSYNSVGGVYATLYF